MTSYELTQTMTDKLDKLMANPDIKNKIDGIPVKENYKIDFEEIDFSHIKNYEEIADEIIKFLDGLYVAAFKHQQGVVVENNVIPFTWWQVMYYKLTKMVALSCYFEGERSKKHGTFSGQIVPPSLVYIADFLGQINIDGLNKNIEDVLARNRVKPYANLLVNSKKLSPSSKTQ